MICKKGNGRKSCRAKAKVIDKITARRPDLTIFAISKPRT